MRVDEIDVQMDCTDQEYVSSFPQCPSLNLGFQPFGYQFHYQYHLYRVEDIWVSCLVREISYQFDDTMPLAHERLNAVPSIC